MSPEAGEVEVVTLTGRLGRDPWHRPDGDEPIGGFPLAINDDRGQTTWHRVVVFGETAQKLREAHAKGLIRKGRSVSVTGQQTIREETTARGVKKTLEFHATDVTHMRAPRPAR
jgi:single-stranded DNA-binding protein